MSLSDRAILTIGVPQGSILGPLLFIMYTKDIDTIALTRGFQIHLYADDTQIYFTFDSSDPNDLEYRIAACMEDVKAWMLLNFLKLNESKTEIMIISPKRDNTQVTDIVKINNNGDLIKLAG